MKNVIKKEDKIMDDLMVNENEIIEVAEEIGGDDNKNLKIAAIVGITVLAGGLTYKFVVKPILAKFKGKKLKPVDNVTVVDFDNNQEED